MHHRDAIGIGEICPRLSWTVQTTIADWYQAGYEIEAYGPDGRLRERTERLASDQSVLVRWPFAPLSSRERLTVRVRVWGIDEGIPPHEGMTLRVRQRRHVLIGLDEDLRSVAADDGEKGVSIRLLESCLKAKLVAIKSDGFIDVADNEAR